MASELETLLAEATPGPWASAGKGYVVVDADRDLLIFQPDGAGDDETERDAELIVYLRNNAERFAALERAVQAVRRMHLPSDWEIGKRYCEGCSTSTTDEPWPCPTERAIRDAMGENDG